MHGSAYRMKAIRHDVYRRDKRCATATITTTTMTATYNSAKYMRQGQNIPGLPDPLIRFNPYPISAFDPDQFSPVTRVVIVQ